MILNFNIDKHIERFLPLHKRRPNRLKFLRFLLSELKTLWQNYVAWREELLYRMNVTGQTLSLENHLNKVIPGANDSIQIFHYDDQGLFVGLEEEGGGMYAEVGLYAVAGEESQFIHVALEGEVQESIGVDFKVSVPAGVNINRVAGELEQYKLAGKSYLIQQS